MQIFGLRPKICIYISTPQEGQNPHKDLKIGWASGRLIYDPTWINFAKRRNFFFGALAVGIFVFWNEIVSRSEEKKIVWKKWWLHLGCFSALNSPLVFNFGSNVLNTNKMPAWILQKPNLGHHFQFQSSKHNTKPQAPKPNSLKPNPPTPNPTMAPTCDW